MRLTERERIVLEAAWKYPTSEEAADAVGMQRRTFNAYLHRTYRLLDVNNKTAAIRRAMELGLIEVYS